MVAGGVAAAGGGAVEEGDEELAHGGDAGGDYDYELFGPEEGGVSGVVGRGEEWDVEEEGEVGRWLMVGRGVIRREGRQDGGVGR